MLDKPLISVSVLSQCLQIESNLIIRQTNHVSLLMQPLNKQQNYTYLVLLKIKFNHETFEQLIDFISILV